MSNTTQFLPILYQMETIYHFFIIMKTPSQNSKKLGTKPKSTLGLKRQNPGRQSRTRKSQPVRVQDLHQRPKRIKKIAVQFVIESSAKSHKIQAFCHIRSIVGDLQRNKYSRALRMSPQDTPCHCGSENASCSVTSCLNTVIDKLNQEKYSDPQQFFSDMEQTFRGLLRHSKKGSEMSKQILILQEYYHSQLEIYRLITGPTKSKPTKSAQISAVTNSPSSINTSKKECNSSKRKTVDLPKNTKKDISQTESTTDFKTRDSVNDQRKGAKSSSRFRNIQVITEFRDQTQ